MRPDDRTVSEGGVDMNLVRFTADRGGVLGFVGGAMTLLAQYGLPLISAPVVGSMTAADLVGQVNAAFSLAMVPVFAVLAMVMGIWLTLARPEPRAARAGGAILVACAALTVIAYLWPLGGLRDVVGDPDLSVISLVMTFIGPGFWLGVVAVVVQAAAGVVTLIAVRTRPAVVDGTTSVGL